MTPGGILRGKILLGHRGTRIMAPENTVPAFDFALQHGAHALETDVRLSRDGHVIVTHDDTLDRTVLASFHDRMLNVVRSSKIGALTAAGVSDMKAMMLCHLMRRHKHFVPEPDFYQIPPWHKGIPLASAGFIRSIHRCGRHVHYWTINNPAQAARLLRRGADGIVSDRADLMAPLFDDHRAQ